MELCRNRWILEKPGLWVRGALIIGYQKLKRSVVYGVDECSGAHDLVTALLDDTISYNLKNAELLYSRPRDAAITIE